MVEGARGVSGFFGSTSGGCFLPKVHPAAIKIATEAAIAHVFHERNLFFGRVVRNGERSVSLCWTKRTA